MTLSSNLAEQITRDAPDGSMRTALLTVRNGRGFLENHFHEARLDGVFVPDHLELAVGENVRLEVAFVDPPMFFQTRGVVRWKRFRGSKGVRAGIGIEYAQEEQAVRQMLLAFAQGRGAGIRSRSRRFPVCLPVHLDDGRVAVTEDLSRGGARLLLDGEQPAPGTHLRLRLADRRGSDVTVLAEVVWAQKGAPSSVGVRFLGDDATAQRIARLLESPSGFRLRRAS